MNEITEIITPGDDAESCGRLSVQTVNPPIYSGSTVLFERYEDLLLANAGEFTGVCYGTDRLPTQREFEDSLARLEGGFLTRAFQSGLNAITHTLMAFTQSGDHILVCDNVYSPNARFCRKILAKYNVEVTFIPPEAGADVQQFIRPETKLIFLESPGSNTFEIQDMPAISKIASERNIVTVLDNTWATPLYLKPFELGIDVSIQSVTKYISGHSDVLLGATTVNEKWAGKFADYYKTLELFASPQDCYLALRGMKTLAVRLRQHEKSAMKVARWLETVKQVGTVIHPALPSHPQHHLWQRDFKGAAGLFAFTFSTEPNDDKVAAFVNALRLFGIGYSWGGFKSLVTAGKYSRKCNSAYTGKTIIRLNIGLEDSDDLISDLENAFRVIAES
jgi:cystathionine beta-lyase